MTCLRLIVTIVLAGGASVLARPLVAEEALVRETLQRHGWSIGFAPRDRDVAERLADEITHFEERIAQIETMTFGFGSAQIEATSAELAACLARWCALPAREAEFRREIERLLPHLRMFEAELNRLMAVRSVQIWRADDARERFQADGAMPGLVWDEKENRAKRHIGFHTTLNPPDYTISWNTNIAPAIFLPLNVTSSPQAAMKELTAEFDSWTDALRHVHKEVDAMIVRAGMAAVAGNVVRGECSDDPSGRWIAEGLGHWAWREVAFTRVPAKQVERYALFAAPLRVISAGQPRLDLEAWPEDRHDDAVMMARQVFCNVEERHGAEAVPQLMNEFWKLPRAQRTSAALKSIYRELMLEPLEARAPWRSLGGWDVER